MSAKCFAYHVDLHGTARASYELKANDDANAVAEARGYLRLHPTLEVWQGARWVASLAVGEPAGIRGHEADLDDGRALASPPTSVKSAASCSDLVLTGDFRSVS